MLHHKACPPLRGRLCLRHVNIQTAHLIFTAMLIQAHSVFLSPGALIRSTAHKELEICSEALEGIG